MKKLVAFALFLIVAGGFASCSQQLGVPLAAPGNANDFFWQPSQLTHGLNYYVLRNGIGSYHLLSSADGSHVEDGALSNEVTMVVHSSADSVALDSMGVNSIFSLPKGYYFGADSSAPDILVHDTIVQSSIVRDTAVRDTVILDSSGKSTTLYDTTINNTFVSDTVIRDTLLRDTAAGRLLLLLRTELDSGHSWRGGTLYGPAFPNGIPVTATVLDRVDSLHIPPTSPGADSTFGASFQIRYAPQQSSDSLATSPIYWMVYYSLNTGPVLIQQYTFGTVTQSAQLVGQ